MSHPIKVSLGKGKSIGTLVVSKEMAGDLAASFQSRVLDTEALLQEFDQMTYECHVRNGHKCKGCLGYYPHKAIRALIAATGKS